MPDNELQDIKEMILSLSNRIDQLTKPDVTIKPKHKKQKRQRRRRKKKTEVQGSTNPTQNSPQEVDQSNNKFLTMKEFTEHQEDSKVDQQLSHNRTPSERDRGSGLIDVLCSTCRRPFQVPPSLIQVKTTRADSGEKLRYICNDCSLALRRS